MTKIIYRGFDVPADTSADSKETRERTYRGVRYVPTDRKYVCGKSGHTRQIYPGVVAA